MKRIVSVILSGVFIFSICIVNFFSFKAEEGDFLYIETKECPQ